MQVTKHATYRKSDVPGMGWIVSVLGTDYTQRRTRDEARAVAKGINARCAGMDERQIRSLYRLGEE